MGQGDDGRLGDPAVGGGTQIYSNDAEIRAAHIIQEHEDEDRGPGQTPYLSNSASLDKDMTGSRKCTSRLDEGQHSADESVPIILHAQGNTKDYNSISPSLLAQTTTGDNSRSGAAGRARERQRETNREEAERRAAEQERNESGRWRVWVEKYGSVELENKGSVARDHLALGTLTTQTIVAVSSFHMVIL